MYIYTSIIQPKIDYAISIWGYTTAHNINKVQRLQNRAARILTGNFDYVNTRGIDLVKTLGLMNVTRSTVNNNVHVPHIILECCKNALPIEVRFYGMSFQKILRNAKR